MFAIEDENMVAFTEERYQEVRRRIRLRRLAAEIAAIEWDALPRFQTVEAFMAWLNEPCEEPCSASSVAEG
jgi:hypothetical protein